MKREIYELNPKKCEFCDMVIPYKRKVEYKRFCNLRCSSAFNNKKRYPNTKIIDNICNECGVDFKTTNTSRKYCSQECSHATRKKNKIDQWKNGEITGYVGKLKQLRPFIRRYLFATRGTACSMCGWDKRHPVDDSILTEIDHIDGNAENCCEENLRILCPNCHAMTPTHRSRNKNGTRNTRYSNK